MERAAYLGLLETRLAEITASMLGLARNDKVGTAEFRKLSYQHAILISLANADGGSPEEQAEGIKKLRESDTARES